MKFKHRWRKKSFSLVLRITDLIRISTRWWMDALFTVGHVLYQCPSRDCWVDFSHSLSTVGPHGSPGLCWTPLQITLLSFCPFCKASKFADQTHSYMHPMIFCDLLWFFFFMWRIFKLLEDQLLRSAISQLNFTIWSSYQGISPALSCRVSGRMLSLRWAERIQHGSLCKG